MTPHDVLTRPGDADAPVDRAALAAAARRAHLAERDRRRGRHRAIGASVLCVAIAGGIAAAVALGQVGGGGGNGLPRADADALGHRSATIRERIMDLGVERASNTVRTDVLDRSIEIASSKPRTSAVLIDGTWSTDASGAWAITPTDAFLDRLADQVLLRADGFSTGEAFPGRSADYVEIVDIVDAPFDGHATRKYRLIVHADDLIQDDADAYAELSAVWGDPEQTQVVAEGVHMPDIDATLIRPYNLSLWIDDEGWIWQWSSDSGLSGITIGGWIEGASDRAFAPVRPA